MIREAIARQMKTLDLTTYRLAKMVEPAKITQTTVYRVVSDGGDTTIANLDAILSSLRLIVVPRHPRTPRSGRRQTGTRPSK